MSAVPETDSAADLAALRDELAGSTLGTASVERIYRRVAGCPELADLKVAWLGNHTLEPVLRHATAVAFTRGLTLASHVGAFDQHFQEIVDPASALHAFAPGAIVLSLSLRGLAPALVTGGASLTARERHAEAERVLEHVRQWVSAAAERTAASLVICNFPRTPRPALGLADPGSAAGEAAVTARLNERLASAYRNDPRVHVLDVDLAIGNAGRMASWNPPMYHLARIEWSGPGLAAAAELLARALRALVRPAKKCLLLDLDDTLWGGIVGEDGVEGLRIEAGDAKGDAFLAFQRVILDLKARGVLLGLVSKNNRADVEEAFRSLDMPLRLEHFAATRIDWQPKHSNIESIVAELGIGYDSVVFVDDNPVECELVRQALPEVEVIRLPGDPAAYADLLADCWHFDKLALTEEDARKTEQYRDNAARVESRRTAVDLSAYLESLGTRVEIGAATEARLARLHQLFGKTNQFNATTRRYTLAELQQFAESEDWLLEWIRVRDNFGDLGVVGAYLVRLDMPEPEIDSFILSCRALGREIETAACNRIRERVFGAGASALRARFIPTRKNRPAADFYEAQGFTLVGTAADGTRSYRLAADDGAPRPCAVHDIAIIEGCA